MFASFQLMFRSEIFAGPQRSGAISKRMEILKHIYFTLTKNIDGEEPESTSNTAAFTAGPSQERITRYYAKLRLFHRHMKEIALKRKP